jgi:hypothetical protein
MNIYKLGSALIFLFFSNYINSQSIKNEFSPKFDASIKTKYEYAFETDMSRFSVRNSRMGISGNISLPVSYRVQVELSSEGKFEVLDLSANINIFKGFSVTLGQTGLPIFNSYIITPSQMMFANRAFIGKYYTGTRDIGLLASYSFSFNQIPLSLQAGVFNGSSINNPVWTNSPSYAVRLQIGDMTGLRTTAKLYHNPLTIESDYLFLGADIRYAKERFKLEAEVMNRRNRYSNIDRFSYYIQGAKSFPLKKSEIFKDFACALRWDSIAENLLYNSMDANRLTFGLSLGLSDIPFTSLLRFDYEHYFVKRPIPEFSRNDEMDSSKFTVELLIIF